MNHGGDRWLLDVNHIEVHMVWPNLLGSQGYSVVFLYLLAQS